MNRNYEDLVGSGRLKPVAGRGSDQATRLLRRAARDLRTAELLFTNDEAAAMDLIYKSIFHAANALLRLQGFRPGDRRQHAGVVEAVRRTLGKNAESLLTSYDRLRRNRNKFEYQAIFSMSSSELRATPRQSKELVTLITNKIMKDHPELEL